MKPLTTSVSPSGHRISTPGVVGRKSGTLAGYAYTPAMTHANLTWDATTLDHFLANSTAKVPGTSMPVEIADETRIILAASPSLDEGDFVFIVV
jgi:cytochrome c2